MKDNEKYLQGINSPADLKKLNTQQLNELCGEIRNELVDVVSSNGGHLASNLGVVELTVAIHKAFDSPKDKIVFDVGHQCYTHKILTGRKDEFKTIRQKDGLSGFPKPEESEHDLTICGHSSVSISTAYGIASSTEHDGYTIALIGDGAMTGGIAYEGLLNSGRANNKFIVFLNDNQMSISRNVGGIKKHLTHIRTRRSYFKFKVGLERFFLYIPLIGKPITNFLVRLKKMFKNAIYHSNMFEDLGFQYLGPIDGHDLKQLDEIISIAKTLKKPTLIHAITTKGKGYSYAENTPQIFHGVSAFNVDSGLSEGKKVKSFSDVFGETVLDVAEQDDKVVLVTAAMALGTGLEEFSKKHKQRFYDVGIAEQHAAAFSGGLAVTGMKPVFAVYSTFLQRAYDQIFHDNAIADLGVMFAIDRAGFVGEDGETHQGIYDTSFLNSIPNISVYSPSNFNELKGTIKNCLDDKLKLSAVRYPRGTEDAEIANLTYTGNDFDVFFEGGDILLVTYGREFANVYNAVVKLRDNGINVTIIKLNKIKPISKNAVKEAEKYSSVYFFEEGIKFGGIAERFGSLLLEDGFIGKYDITAVDNGLFPQMSVKDSFIRFALDDESIYNKILEKESAK